MTTRTVSTIEEELNVKRAALADIFDEAKTDEGLKMTEEKIDEVRQRNAELNDLGIELEKAREMDEIYKANQAAIREAKKPATNLPFRGQKAGDQDPEQKNGRGDYRPAQPRKSMGALFTESKAYQNRMEGDNKLDAYLPDVNIKTLMDTSAGWAPENLRIDRWIEDAQRQPVIFDFLPSTVTDQAAIVYMEETTFTNNAAETSEGGSYGEAALAYTEQTETVRKIATFLPVTDEQMSDVPQVQSIINNRLSLMLLQRAEAQVLTGDGNAPNLDGFLNKSGVQTQALGADPVPDAVYKAMTLVRATGRANPTGAVFHPNDWQSVRLLRTVDGVYIWGSPAEAGPERIWGLPVLVTTAITENTALVGDFQMYSEVYNRSGVNFKVSDSHSDYFVKGKLAIRADLRMALVIYRPAAFCKVTGI